MSDLIFADHPDVMIADITFRKTPVILQYEDGPLIDVVSELSAGFNTRFAIYHSDGTKLAVVRFRAMGREPKSWPTTGAATTADRNKRRFIDHASFWRTLPASDLRQ